MTYKIYESSTLKAQVTQPTGSSRLCLSCHDGILALSNVRALPRGQRIVAMGPLIGKASLGVDLSDDHPISFIYNSALALTKGDLIDPVALPRQAPLEEGEMQCTSCHDPHEDRRPNFLRIDNRMGAECTVCHRYRYWSGSSHAISNETLRGYGDVVWSRDGYQTVAENACLNCHRVHSAPHPERLLAQTDEEKNCTVCHNGGMVRKNIEAEIFKPSHHPIEARQWTHDPAEDPVTMPRHVTCVDCHNPHAAVSSMIEQPPIIPGALRGVSGVTIGGAQTREANFEYEVCLKCHGINEPVTLGIVRRSGTRSIRLKIDPSSMSYHPFAAPGRNPRVLGLMSPYNVSSMLSCTDCHNNDQWVQRSGAVPRGPHGSRFEPILQMEYETEDPSPESYSSYALCYKCHDRSSVLFGGGFGGFPHRQHVIDQQISCAICHDPHGSRQNPHLIDFMLLGKLGNPVVRPAKSGRLDYVADAARPGHGKCWLSCHNAQHDPASY